jgi:hypothetical protein
MSGNQNSSIAVASYSFVQDTPAQIDNHIDTAEISYFDLLDEIPEFSEAAVILEDEIIEYCYVKNGNDGKQYFGFDRCLPGSDQYEQVLSRHKLVTKMEANTYERYPSGKIVLSRRGKILAVYFSKESTYV